jgi:hypothetical protein
MADRYLHWTDTRPGRPLSRSLRLPARTDTAAPDTARTEPGCGQSLPGA